MYIQTLCNPVFSHICRLFKDRSFWIKFSFLNWLIFKPISDPKIIHFSQPSQKNTLVQNLCGLRVYIKFIFWGPQQQWFGKSHGATGFLNMESVHQYLHWRKIPEETIRDNFLPLSIAICPCLSFPARLTEVSIFPFVCVCLSNFCQSTSLSVNLSIHLCFSGWRVCCKKNQKNISHHLTDNPDHSKEKTNRFLDLAPADCSSRRSWQLIASRLSIVQPPSTETWLVQEQESVARLFDRVRQTSGNQYTVYASPVTYMSGFWFSTVSLVLMYCV